MPTTDGPSTVNRPKYHKRAEGRHPVGEPPPGPLVAPQVCHRGRAEVLFGAPQALLGNSLRLLGVTEGELTAD